MWCGSSSRPALYGAVYQMPFVPVKKSRTIRFPPSLSNISPYHAIPPSSSSTRNHPLPLTYSYIGLASSYSYTEQTISTAFPFVLNAHTALTPFEYHTQGTRTLSCHRSFSCYRSSKHSDRRLSQLLPSPSSTLSRTAQLLPIFYPLCPIHIALRGTCS
ncbi:hypothetical protein B9Z19DRAFT_422711 [Tuber borchii]|uniref:Uncharacterized protein n=1 Tax=Tuber borchii TaxID=42251 RepID=A0A2T6ZGL6_TUBBO|nr:hypothetical protein B9Z19DRAFT_422711 [Tuber borchii]